MRSEVEKLVNEASLSCKLSDVALRLLYLLAADPFLKVSGALAIGCLRRAYFCKMLGESEEALDDAAAELQAESYCTFNPDEIYVLATMHLPGCYIDATMRLDPTMGLQAGYNASSSELQTGYRDSNLNSSISSSLNIKNKKKNSARAREGESSEIQKLLDEGKLQLGLEEPEELTDEQVVEALVKGWPRMVREQYRAWMQQLHASRVSGRMRISKVLKFTRDIDTLLEAMGADATAYALDAAQLETGAVDNMPYLRKCCKTFIQKATAKRATPKLPLKKEGDLADRL